MSVTLAKALMIKLSGDVTLRFTPAWSQTLFIDIESLPTGIAMPSAGQSSIPTA